MLQIGESQRTIDSQELGMFEDMYSHHGSQEVPSTLRACELLSPGEKVVLDRDGELVFAGLVRARPLGILAPSINVTRWRPDDPETATISLPLHYRVTHDEHWGTRLWGGGTNRDWVDVCKLILGINTIDESDLSDKVLSVGDIQIRRRMSMIENEVTKAAMKLVIDAPEDRHIATDGIGISVF